MAEAALTVALTSKNTTEQELHQAQKALELAQKEAERAAAVASEKAKEAEKASDELSAAENSLVAAREQAAQAEQALKDAKANSKTFDAIAVLVQGINDSVVIRNDKNYFEISKQLNSNGVNFAGTMNTYLEENATLDGQDYTYCIYKCKGTAQDEYNVFFVFESIVDSETGDVVTSVVKYNTETGTYFSGTTTVKAETTKNTNKVNVTYNILNGEDYSGSDITEDALSAIAAAKAAEDALQTANSTLETAKTTVTEATEANTTAQAESTAAAADSTAAADQLAACEAEKAAAAANDAAAQETLQDAQEKADGAEQEVADAQETLDTADQTLLDANEALANL